MKSKSLIAVLIALLVSSCMLFTACGEEDFDASAAVKESLDCIKSGNISDKYLELTQQSKEEAQKEEFYILLGNFTWQKVLAEPFVKYGIKMFLFCDCGTWKLSHEELGCNIVSGKTKTECIQKLKDYMDKYGKDKFNELIEKNRKMVLEKAGVNPRLAGEVA